MPLFFAVTWFVALFVVRGMKSKLLGNDHTSFIGAALVSCYKPLRNLFFFLMCWQLALWLDLIWNEALKLQRYPVSELLSAFHLGWYGFRVVDTMEKASLDQTETGKLDQTAVIGVAKICRLLLAIIMVIVGFDLLGLDPSGLIALGGVSGAALAFASRDLVANLFGGIMLYMDKPFKVGDWVRSPDREIEGTVEYIGWRITKIRTFDKRPIYVPNSIFNNITVQNPSRMTHRRINETIKIRYNDQQQVKAIVDEIREYLQGSELIAKDEIIIVNFNGFGASSLDILVYCMTVTIDWQTFHQHKEMVLLDIADIVLNHGAEFAFPTQTLHLQEIQEMKENAEV